MPAVRQHRGRTIGGDCLAALAVGILAGTAKVNSNNKFMEYIWLTVDTIKTVFNGHTFEAI